MIHVFLVALALSLSSCGLFSQGMPPAITQMLEAAATSVMHEAGKELDEVPMSCEWDMYYYNCFHPDPEKQPHCARAEKDARIKMPTYCLEFCRKALIMLCEAREL